MSILSNILEARENRTAMRLDFARRESASISLTFNIPGATKTTGEITEAFGYVVGELNDFLLANRILVNHDDGKKLVDAAGDFYLVPITEMSQSINQLKDLCEQFEQNHYLERILDVDVVDAQGNSISSGKSKKCFLCDRPAIECRRQNNHKFEELQDFIDKKIHNFIIVKLFDKLKIELPAYATQALLFEISLSPKPGLVDKMGTGSHKDMDFFSFLSSAAVLSAYWEKIVSLSYQKVYHQADDELIQLRVIGIEMEKSMRKFTGGVNTHKGAIFILGMLVYAIAKLILSRKKPTDSNIKAEIIRLNKENLSDELLNFAKYETHGKNVAQKYGKNLGGGVRKEVALGLPMVFDYALPVLRKFGAEDKGFLTSEKSSQQGLTACLLTIISQNNDSNVLHRANSETLLELKRKAKICLNNKGNFKYNYKKLCDFCVERNISPGGSADLLAAAIFVYNSTKFII